MEVEDQKLFNKAYEKRIGTNAIATVAYVCVFIYGIAGLYFLVTGQEIRGAKYFGFSALAFVVWYIVHNRAIRKALEKEKKAE